LALGGRVDDEDSIGDAGLEMQVLTVDQVELAHVVAGKLDVALQLEAGGAGSSCKPVEGRFAVGVAVTGSSGRVWGLGRPASPFPV
jgi:hypothetical protein